MKHINLQRVFRDNPHFRKIIRNRANKVQNGFQFVLFREEIEFFSFSKLPYNLIRILKPVYKKINGAYARFYKVIKCGNLGVGRSASHFRVSRMYLLVSFTGCLLLPGPCLSDGLLTRNYVFGDSTRLCSRSLLLDCTPA